MILSLCGRRIDIAAGTTYEALTRLWNLSDDDSEPTAGDDPVAVVIDDRRPPRVPDADAMPARPDGLRIFKISDDEFRVGDPTRPARMVGVHVGEPSIVSVSDTGHVSAAALDVAMSEVLAATGLVRLHAAAVTDRRRTLAFLGPSGRGKSSTALRAIRAGWQPMAEDGLLLDVATLHARSCDDAVRLRSDGVEALVVPVTPPAPGERLHIPFDELGGRVAEGRLTDLVHLRRGPDDEPRWSTMSDADAVMALFEASGAPISARVRSVLATAFPEVVRGLCNLRLVLGSLTSTFPTPPDPARSD